MGMETWHRLANPPGAVLQEGWTRLGMWGAFICEVRGPCRVPKGPSRVPRIPYSPHNNGECAPW